jgi:Putative prokaryotic signal transducing protein
MPFPFQRKPRDNAPKPNDLVIVTTAENQMAADMTLGILRMHQIPCMARPRGIGIAYLGLALQPHDILVRTTDRERAEEILHAFSDADDVKLLWR